MIWIVWIDKQYKWHCSSSPSEESGLETAKVMMNKYETLLTNPRIEFMRMGLFSHFSLQGELIADKSRPNLIRKAVGCPSQVWVVNTNSRGKAIMIAKKDYQSGILDKES